MQNPAYSRKRYCPGHRQSQINWVDPSAGIFTSYPVSSTTQGRVLSMMLCTKSGLKYYVTTVARSTYPRMMSSSSNSETLTISSLPLYQPSPLEEDAQLELRTKEMAEFFARPRFNSIKRPYAPSAVASKQGSFPVLPLPGTLLADKLYNLLSKAADERRPVHTMGAIDPVQMTQMAKHQEVVYVSGWACSSVLTTGNNEVGPDLGYILAFHLN